MILGVPPSFFFLAIHAVPAVCNERLLILEDTGQGRSDVVRIGGLDNGSEIACQNTAANGR